MEHNPKGNPYNSGIIVDAAGELKLYYRKLHSWVPVEPWEPGDLGIPVCDGPQRQQARADHLPRRDVPGDGARVRVQGRRDHDPYGRLHRADPPRLADHQPGHRGYVAVKGGAQDCPYTFMQDLAAGRYRVPWEERVEHHDGRSCGFEPPTRLYGEEEAARPPSRPTHARA